MDPNDPIYYVFRRSDGLFQGSGVTLFDDAEFGSTIVPAPGFDPDEAERPYWTGEAWELR